MKLIKTKIKNLLIVKTNIYKDRRGFFKEIEKSNILKKNSDRLHRSYNAKFNPVKGFEYGIMPPHPSIFIKKELYRKFGDFNTCYEIASDYDLILRLIRVEKVKFKYIDSDTVSCSGDSSANSHPLIYLDLSSGNIITCPYCSAKFKKSL